jgi:hypothetical protein
MVSDCIDGMIARLKHSGTAVGRIIDGFADYIVAISVYVGMGIGFEKGLINLDFLPINHWWIMAIAAASHIFHSMLVDYYRAEFMAHGLGKATSTFEEKKKFTAELNKIKHLQGKLMEKVLIAFYLGYSHLQLFHLEEKEEYDRKIMVLDRSYCQCFYYYYFCHFIQTNDFLYLYYRISKYLYDRFMDHPGENK